MNDTSIESRFEGHDILEAGVAQIPNMLISHYQHLGLSDGQFTLLCHILSRKWTKDAPYPSITGIKMSANVDTRRRYVRDLRQKGLLFTSRLYWTKEDMDQYPQAYPGRVRSNLWYLGSLMHNLARMDRWLKEGNSPDTFQVEIPLTTVRMFLKGDFHDTPKEIEQAIKEQTKGGTVLRAVTLVCENHIVEPSMRKTSTRKSHSLKEETESKKNHKTPPDKKKSPRANGSAGDSPSKLMFEALANICKASPELMRGQLNRAEKELRNVGATPEKLEAFGKWWYANDFRGKLGKPPTPEQVKQLWRQFEESVTPVTSRASPPKPAYSSPEEEIAAFRAKQQERKL